MAAAATTLTLGAAGIAYAGDYDNDHGGHHHHGDHDSNATNCASHETTTQKNKGNQLIGGSVIGRDINGFIGGSIDKPACCPSVADNNHFKL